MKYVSLLMLAAFAAWAASVVRTDMATKKITNASILGGLKLTGAGLGLFAACSALGAAFSLPAPAPAFYPHFGLHLLLSVLAGTALWYAEVWPAGDAKFYMVLSCALPLAAPAMRHFPNLLFLTFLINVFVSAALWAGASFLLSGFDRSAAAQYTQSLAASARRKMAALGGGDWRALAGVAVMVATVFMAQQVLRQTAMAAFRGVFARADVLYFFFFILWDKLLRLFKSKLLKRAVLAASAAFLVSGFFFFPDRLAAAARGALLNVAGFGTLLIFCRFLLEFVMEQKDIIRVLPEELKAGMVLSSSERSWIQEEKEFGDAFEDSFRDGLTEEQAELLRAWLRRMPAGYRMETVRGRPFALWIAVGAAMTLFFNGGVLHFHR